MTRNKSAIAYTGVRADTPPNFKTSNGPPDSEDFAEFLLGDFWLDLTNDDLYVLISKQGGSATWILLSGGSGSTITFNTDSGNAQPNTGVINVVGGANIDTSGAGSTVTVAVEDAIDLPDTTSASVGTYLFNGSRFMHAFGDNSNAFIGDLSGNFTLSGVNNTTVGQLTGTSLTTGFDNTITGASAGASLTTGDNNAFFGSAAGGSVDTGRNNTYIGAAAGSAATSAANNVAIGDTALDQLTTGNRNIVVGATSGGNYTSSESDNILINSLGVASDSNVLRIGTDGTGNFEIDQAFIAGIWQRTPAGSTEVVTIDSNGELGSTAISPGGINDLQGDGGGTATGSTITIAGGANIDTTTGGSTVTVAVEDSIDLPNTTGLNTGTYSFNGTRFMHQYGDTTNTFIGQNSGNFSLTGTDLTGIGSGALASVTSGSQNSGIGEQSLFSLTTGSTNMAFGTIALNSLTTGNTNLGIGGASGGNYTTESNNITINNLGVVGDSNVMRIGEDGTGSGQTNQVFIAGIWQRTPAGSTEVVTIDSSGELGSTAISPGGINDLAGDTGTATGSTVTIAGGDGITTSASGSTVTINGFGWEVVNISKQMDPDTGYISNSVVALTLPLNPGVGSRFRAVAHGALWEVAQLSGQTVHFGSSSTTTGASGKLEATALHDAVEIVCVFSDGSADEFIVISSVGNITVT